jgi:hypothetical protein
MPDFASLWVRTIDHIFIYRARCNIKDCGDRLDKISFMLFSNPLPTVYYSYSFVGESDRVDRHPSNIDAQVLYQRFISAVIVHYHRTIIEVLV